MARPSRRLNGKGLFSEFDSRLIVLLGMVVVGYAIHGSASVVFSAQTKAECQKCCEQKDLDEYFMDQCKVKCFRNPDHCTTGKATTKSAPKKRTTKRKRSRRAFRWPNPLNLTPGNEWEAAAEILSMNGITPQHPNAAPALQAVEALLKEFVRTSPQGGRMPTQQIQQVIRQYR